MTYITNQTKEKDDDVVAQTKLFPFQLLTNFYYFMSQILHRISQLNKRSNIIIIIIFGVWHV